MWMNRQRIARLRPTSGVGAGDRLSLRPDAQRVEHAAQLGPNRRDADRLEAGDLLRRSAADQVPQHDLLTRRQRFEGGESASFLLLGLPPRGEQRLPTGLA